jgi:hypothetical protein
LAGLMQARSGLKIGLIHSQIQSRRRMEATRRTGAHGV